MQHRTRSRRQIASGVALVVLAAVTGLPAVVAGAAAAPISDAPAYICHDNGTTYTKETAAIVGHLSGHRRDIVPPYSDKPAGVNWTTAGQAVWNANCTGSTPDVVTAPPDKVTICHRTHATTNPYRRITVAAAAVDGAGANDHTQHSGVGSLFDPTYEYPPNAKIWDDIIPDATGGGIDPGLHWTLEGEALYANSCAVMTAQQFAGVELAAGRTLEEVAADLLEQGAEGDPATAEEIASVVDAAAVELGLDPSPTPDPTETSATPDPTETSATPDPTDTSATPDPTETSATPDPTETSATPDPTETSATPEPTETSASPEPSQTSASPSSTPIATPDAGVGRMRVRVFLDSDGDGVQGPGEPGLSGARIVLVGPEGTRELLTDEDGWIDVTDLPAGTWDVESAEVDGLELTGDSDGAADRLARVEVPRGGTARAWFGLQGRSALELAVDDEDGPWTGTADVLWLGPDAAPGEDDLGLQVRVVGGTAGIQGVPAGRYQVSVGSVTTSVVVTTGGVGTAVLTDVQDMHPATGASVLPLLAMSASSLLLGLLLIGAGQAPRLVRRH